MTGDAKPMHKANLKKRIVATLLDYALIFVLIYLYVILLGESDGEGRKTVSGVMALPVPIVWFVYFVVIETLYGATLGHQVLGLRVLTVDHKQIGFVHALKRRLFDPVDILLYGIPAIVAIKNSDKHQRLGDIWAHTIVVDIQDNAQNGFRKSTEF
jgi:uncharacterized RDD family membrane protein YckC